MTTDRTDPNRTLPPHPRSAHCSPRCVTLLTLDLPDGEAAGATRPTQEDEAK